MMYDASIAESCIAKRICSQYGVGCSMLCVGYSELQNQILLSGMPRRYINIGKEPASITEASKLVSSDNPKVAQWLERFGTDLALHIETGNGLYLHSATTGTGKTTVATSVGCDYIRLAVSKAMEDRRAADGTHVMYVHVPTYIRTAKQIYEGDPVASAQAASEVARLTTKMVGVPLLILDDIGAEKPSETVRERLLTLIDHRVINCRSTIYTSNLTLDELEFALGARIRSRIEGSTAVLKFGGHDHRRRVRK